MKKQAFTLTELLVVIGILALLLMVLSPSLTSTLSIARRTLCQNNLSELSTVLSQAKETDFKHAVSVSEVIEYFPDRRTWPVQAYTMSNSLEVFRCPEDELPALADVAGLRKRIVFRSTWGGGVEIPLTGLGLNEHYLCRTGSNSKGTYTEYVFEEAGNITKYNWDFWDPTQHNDGWIRIFDTTGDIEILSCNCGGDNQLWIDNKPAFGTDPTNRDHIQIQRNVGKILNAGAGVAGLTSYGVNSFAHRYNYGSSVLVLMEYETDGMTMSADPDEPAKVREQLLKSLRHRNRMNIMIADGSVRVVSLSKIDPIQNRELWNPTNLAPHPDD